MKSGIGYTIVNGSQYALVAQPHMRRVNEQRWDLTDAGERAAQEAAREQARRRKVAYIGFER